MASVALIKSCLNIAHFSGLARILRKPLQGRGSILCFHHIVPPNIKDGEFSPNAKLEISPEFLRAIIQRVRKLGYETMSLSQAIENLKNPNASNKPFVVFTLDDGYRDNMIYAQPIFAELNCPYTVYFTPGIVDGTVELWWRGLERIIAENISVYVEIDGITHSYKTETVAEKYKAWAILSSALQKAPEYTQREIIRQIAKRYDVDLKSLCLETALNWNEVATLAKDPLCTIGAHTMGHYAIAKLDIADATKELVQSRFVISKNLNRPIEHFAFPYGDENSAGPRDFVLAKEAGFASSVVTRAGVVFAEHKDHLQALPRIMISGRYAKLRYVEAMMLGVPSFFINKLKKLNID